MSRNTVHNSTRMPKGIPQGPNPTVATADLAGTFVFAVEGSLAAIAAHLDLFGVMVLAFTTALTLFLPQRSEASTSQPAQLPARHPRVKTNADRITTVRSE